MKKKKFSNLLVLTAALVLGACNNAPATPDSTPESTPESSAAISSETPAKSTESSTEETSASSEEVTSSEEEVTSEDISSEELSSSEDVSSIDEPSSSEEETTSSEEIQSSEETSSSEEASTSEDTSSEESSAAEESSSSEESSVHEHAYGSWSIETMPSETSKGLAKKTCECGDVVSLELPLLSDSAYSKGEDTATCTADGVIHYTYTVESETIEFDVHTVGSHNYLDDSENSTPASYLSKGKKAIKCSKCGDVQYEDIPQLATTEELGVLNSDLNITLSGHNVGNATGENKIADGLFFIGSEDEPLNPQIDDGSKKDRVFVEGGISPDSRMILINAGAPCHIDVTMGAKSAGKEVSLALFDANSDLTSRTGYVEGEIATTSSSSNAVKTFEIEKAGLYALGSTGGSFKVSQFVVEFHEVDESQWSFDETGHWHPSTGEGCSLSSEKENHSYGDGVEAKAPQIGVPGEMVYTCSTCGYEKHEEIPALVETVYGFDNTHHWVEGDDENKVAHSDGDVTTVKEPSYFEDGLGQATCSVCNKVHDVVIPKLEIESLGQIDEDTSTVLSKDNVTDAEGINLPVAGIAVIGSTETPLALESVSTGGTDRIFLNDVITPTSNMILIKLGKDAKVSIRFGSKSKSSSTLGAFNQTPNDDRSNALYKESAPSSSNVTKEFTLTAGLWAFGSVGDNENRIKVSNIDITIL